MGTNKEPSAEQSTPEIEEEMDQTPEQNGPAVEEPQQLLNTYKWHTGAKTETPGQGTIERLEKGASTKWNKMQNWRKALSEDAGEKSSTRGGGESPAKSEKPVASRKNPFRRALSEPPGSLLSSVLSSSSTSGSSNAQASGSGFQDTSHRGKIRKYLQTVSQKLKRPRLQSTSIAEQDKGEPENVVQEVRLSWAPQQDVPVWDISSCSLQDGQILIPREEEPMMRVQNRGTSGLSRLSLQNISGSHIELNPDPVVPTSGAKKGQDGGVKGMIKRRLQIDEKRKSNTQLNTAGLSSAGRFGSRESLSIPVSAANSLDLSADQTTIIRPVHSSILGEKYCFQVINSENIHCFGCTSAAERDRWIEDLRRAAHPNKDNCERTENSLSLWVNEAKDLPPKKRYYCEIHLDGTLYARTSSRAIGKSAPRSNHSGEGGSGASGAGHGGGAVGGCQLFWGEFFELDNLPPVTQITLHLFREEDPKKKRYSRDDSIMHPLGSVALTLADIKGRAYQEKWYPIIPYKPPGTSTAKDQIGPQASLRVKAKFQNLKVLPIERYKEFAEHVTVDYVGMCSSLEPLLNVREREELAGALVHVLQSIGKAKEFLIDLGSAEVERLGENEALIFRENTLATKAIDEYMKLVGQKYLIDTLGDFIVRLYNGSESCEVDSQKCSASDLPINQRHLKETCGDVVKRITDMQDSFPAELNEIFSSWVSNCEERGQTDIGHRLISSSLFLRFLCPAILSPSLFGLTQAYPEPNTLRTLTLAAKVIQNLANFTLFGEKEEYMFFMNEFLEQHWEPMRGFLQRVSNPDSEIAMARFDGYVDLPLRLAVLHNLLVDIISPMKQDTIDSLHPLPLILNQITEFHGQDAQRIPVSSGYGVPKPLYVPPKDLSKYTPLHNSMQQLPVDSKVSQGKERQRNQVKRALSVPNRRNQHQVVRKQTSNEDLPTQCQDEERVLAISSPDNVKIKRPEPVPWMKKKEEQNELCQLTGQEEEQSSIDKEILAMEITTPETAKKSSATFSKDCLKTAPDKDLDESGLGVHICEVCGTSFETRKGLSSHARSHLRQLGVYSSGAPIDLLHRLMKERGGTLPMPTNQASTVKKTKAQFPKLKKHNRPKIKIKISNLVKKKYALSSSSTTTVKKSAKSGRFPFAPMKPSKASSKGTAGSKVSKSKSSNEAVKSRLDDGGPSTSLPLASPKPLWAPQETDAPLNLTTMINSTATARDDVHVCELCGAWYETRKGLSSHARAHLRQFGVALDTKCGPIELLHKIIQTEDFQEKFISELQEGTSVLEDCTSTLSTSLSIPKNPSLSPKRLVSMHVTPPPSKKVKIAKDGAGSLTLGGKTDLKSPPQGETSKNISCEFCHEKFKKNQSLASHARGHLRQMGITEWTVHGSPMATLRTVMAQRGAASGSLKSPEPLTPSTPTSPTVPPTVPLLPSSPKVNTQSSSLPVRHKVPKARKGSRTVVPKPKNEPVEVDISIIGSPKPQSEPTSPLSPQKMSAPTTVKSPVTPPKLEKYDPTQFVFCDYCGAMFETRKALSCHARSHLRQLGVKYSEKVSAIDALRELMQKEGNDRASDVKPESSTGAAVQWKKTASSPRTVTPSPVDFTKDKIATPDITTPGFSEATCELCGFDFENRKALASHARAHLRYVGVDWKVIGSPIETLAAWMKNEPTKVADLHKRYSRGDLPLVKKGPRKPPSANHSSDSESVRMGSPKASSGAQVSAGQPPGSPPSKAALVPEAGREIKKEISHSSSSQRKRPPSSEPPLSSLIQSPAAHSGLNVRSPRGFERRPSKHFSHPEKISEETEPSKPSRAGNIPSLVPRPPETRLVKLVGKIYSLKCRFCEEVFHGPLSIQEDWVIHLQQHILKLKKDSTSSPQSSRRRDTVEPSLNRTEAPLLIGPQAV